MSSAATGAGVLQGGSPAVRRVRAFFAPVNRVTRTATAFDAAAFAASGASDPPAPWLDLGPCLDFVRTSGTRAEAVRAGSPTAARSQVRTEIEAGVTLRFERWGKLQLALSAGMQQTNLLLPGAQGGAAAAVPLLTSGGASTATTLNVGATAAAGFSAGSMVAVDVDYSGQTGFIGSGASGGYVSSSSAVSGDVDAVRRVTLNVGLVASVSGGVLTLAEPLLAGTPSGAMQVSQIVGFTDREGGGFFQEWSGLFCAEGEQGDQVIFYYPRLQAVTGAAEQNDGLARSLSLVRLQGSFRALAVKDSLNGTAVVCYRSYVPAPMRLI